MADRQRDKRRAGKVYVPGIQALHRGDPATTPAYAIRLQLKIGPRRETKVFKFGLGPSGETAALTAAIKQRDDWITHGFPAGSPGDDDPPPEFTPTVLDAVRWYAGDLLERGSMRTGHELMRSLSPRPTAKFAAFNWTNDPVVQKFFATPLDLLQGNPNLIREYFHDRLQTPTRFGRPRKKKSVLRERRILHTAITRYPHYDRRIDWPLMPKNQGWSEAKTRVPVKPLTSTERKRLRLALGPEHECALLLALGTNPRRGSLHTRVRGEDGKPKTYALEQAHVHLDDDPENPFVEYHNTKTSELEIAVIPHNIVPYLRAQLARHPGNRWLFPSRHRKGSTTPLTGNMFWEHFKAAAEAIGRPELTFHTIRHVFNNTLKRSGYSTTQRMEAGRWRSEDGIENYMDPYNEDNRALCGEVVDAFLADEDHVRPRPLATRSSGR